VIGNDERHSRIEEDGRSDSENADLEVEERAKYNKKIYVLNMKADRGQTRVEVH
jgi:hypothetical protein